MDLSSPSTWIVIWAVVTVAAGVGEMLVPGTFFMLPFAVGGLVATVASLLGAPVWLGWLLFVTVTITSFIGLIPVRRWLDREQTDVGVGAKRLINREAVVTKRIDPEPGAAGEIRVERELWRATGPRGRVLEEGTVVRIVGIEGTRAIVEPVNRPSAASPEEYEPRSAESGE